jgi:hypothetical protein
MGGLRPSEKAIRLHAFPALPALLGRGKGQGAKECTPAQGKALEALFWASKGMLEDFAERHQIVRLGQLPKASFEEAKAWLTGKLEQKAKA